MAAKKGKRRSRPKSLGKRFSNKPIDTIKSEYKKLPTPAKYAVWSIALGAVGGAAMVSQLNNLPVIGPITGQMAQWGLTQKAKLMP